MPTEMMVEAPSDIASDQREADLSACNLGLRLGLAPASVFALGLIFDWPVFYLAAVFAALFVQAPAPMPALVGLRLLGLSAAMLAVAWLLTAALLPYPIVFLTGIALGLGAALRAAVRGANVLVVVLAMLAALLVPFLGKVSTVLAGLISIWLLINMGLAMLAGWAAFALFPAGQTPGTDTKPDGPGFDPERRLARMCLVSVPFALVFFAIESGAALVLIFVAILATQLAASTAAGPVVAKGMMVANVLGGVAAILIYEALVIAPFLPLAILLVFAACLFFAGQAAAGDPLAGSALTAVLILVGGSLGPISDGAEVKLLARLWQVGLALAYILTAFVLVDRWLPEKKHSLD
ncbi:MAG: hypothetical protein AAGF94_08020 [Pseudomonadota bacterium]